MADNSSSGGLLGIDPSLLMNLGIGLMAGAHYGSNAGQGLMMGLESYRQQKAAQLQNQLTQQQLGMNQMQMQMLQARMPGLQAYYNSLSGLLGGSAQPSSSQDTGSTGRNSAPGAPTTSTIPESTSDEEGPQVALSGPAGNLVSRYGRQSSRSIPAAPAQSSPAPLPAGTSSVLDPFALMRVGAFGGAMDAPGASGLLDYGKALAQYDPLLATQLESAKSAVAVDQQQIQDAIAKGNPQLAQAIYNGKFQQDLGLLHLSSMGGIETRIDPRTGAVSTFNPSTGIQSSGGQASLIPGMSQALRQKAAAEATGEAQGDLERVTDENGNEYYVRKSLLLGNSGAAGAARGPGGTAGSAPASQGPRGAAPFASVAALGPASETLLRDKGAQAAAANKEYQDQAEAGQQMLAQIAELRTSAADFSPGQFADTRIKNLQWLQSAGLITQDEMNRLGSAQAGQKIAIQLQAAATQQLGSREAAQIFTYMGKSLPNLTLSPDGFAKVSAYMEGIARYNIARAQVANNRMSANDVNGLNSVRNDFIANTNPTYFVMASAPPAQRSEMLTAMGDAKSRAFTEAWNKAASAGWAPRPGQYDNGP